MSGEEPRRRLGGFELVELLGRGSFGEVWRARQLRLDRDVAVKVLDPLVARDPDAARRFEREGRSAASLDHPAIVPVYEAGEDDGLYYLAMRLVDGETLADTIEREAPIDLARVVALLDPVADALDAAHAAGLVHRDVKPANILLEEGRTYLSDFGVAASVRELGRYTTGSIGTAEYMAPEQARGEGVDHRADLYGLGCVAYHALTGRSAFRRDDLVSTLLAHSTDPFPPTGDDRLDRFFERALAKDPDDRFASGADFATALRGGPVAPAPQADSPAPRRARRWPLVAAGIAAVVALVAGVVVATGGGDGGDPAAPPIDGGRDTTTTVAGSGDGGGGDPAGTVDELRDGGSVVVGTSLDLSEPNPHASLDTAKVVAEWVLPVMSRVDENLDVVPSLAEGPPVADPDDPLQLTWTIRPDRVWDDGSAVTAADVVATHEYLTAPGTAATNTILYDSIASIEAIDAVTLAIRLEAPTGAAALFFSTIHPIIKNQAWRAHLDAGGTAADFLAEGVGFSAGPYQLAPRQNPGEIALVRNPGWDGDPVALERISLVTYETSAALIEAQRLRQVDVIWVDDVRDSEVRDAAALPDTEVLLGSSSVAVQLTINARSPALQDPRVRQAIRLAIDRAGIVDTAVGRKINAIADPWNSLVFAPGQSGDQQPFADIVDADAAEAERLLDQAGWTRPDATVFRRRGGQDLALSLVLFEDSDSANTALAIDNALQEIGIDITAEQAPVAQTDERMSTGDFDLALQFRLFNSDPVATAQLFGTSACPSSIDGCTGEGINYAGFSDPEVDQALGRADETLDPDARRALYASVDARLHELVAAIPLYVEPAFVAHRADLAGIVMTANVGPIATLADWGYRDG